jgi:hypothetical protein
MLITDFLATLSREEADSLTLTQLSPREKEVLSFLLSNRTEGLADTKTICNQLGISSANLYRLSSPMLVKLYHTLVPEGGVEILRMLARKFLRKHFLVELERQEALLQTEKNTTELAAFYETAFILNMRFPGKDFDFEFSMELADKHNRSLVKPDKDIATYFHIRCIFQEIVAMPSRKKMRISDMAKHGSSLLDGIAPKVEKCKDVRAKILYNDARQVMMEFIHWDPYHQLSLLYKNRDLLAKQSDEKTRPWAEVTTLRIAELEAHIGKHREAFELYRKMNPTSEDLVKRGFLYVNAFLIICFICHEDAVAEQTIHEAFDRELVWQNPQLTLLRALHLILSLLLKRDLKAAGELISQSLSNNVEENFFFMNEVTLRAFETALAYYKKEFPLVHSLVSRHKKWLRSRRYTNDVTSWMLFFTYLDELASGIPPKKSTRERFLTQFAFEWPQYARLLTE